MQTVKQPTLPDNQSTISAEALVDLPVTDAQSQQITGGADVIVGPGPGGDPHVKVFDPITHNTGALRNVSGAN